MLEGWGDGPRRDVMITYSDNRRSDDPWGAAQKAMPLRTHQWHFYWYRDGDDMRLYDVVNDPRGVKDLSKTRPDLVKDFMERILAWRQDKR